MCSKKASGSGSSPDLSSTHLDCEDTFVNNRKRRGTDIECLKELSDFRREMFAHIEDCSNKQNINIAQLFREEMSILRAEIGSIKSANADLAQENKKIQKEVQDIKLANISIENKIANIEEDVKKIKIAEKIPAPTQPDLPQALSKKSLPLYNEDTLREVQERIERQKNIIATGIPEIDTNDSEQRRQNDQQEVIKFIYTIYNDCPNPVKVFRLGKYTPGKNRLLKVCFSCPETVKSILRKQQRTDGGVRFFSDQTPAQKLFMESIKAEIVSREKNGENNLTIKYINNIPTIIKKSEEKNSEPQNKRQMNK